MSTDLPPVLLYDGDCGFCSRTVQFVLAHEPRARRTALRFAPLGGAFGASVRATVPALSRVDSVVWFDAARGIALVRSDAALALARHLGGGWRLLAAFGRLIPRALRDSAYNLIARHRHWLAGAQCVLPAPEWRHRFLD